MTKDEYKCAKCGKIFEKGWSDEEANQEAEELWSFWSVKDASERDDFDVICDDCFKKLMAKKIVAKVKYYG